MAQGDVLLNGDGTVALDSGKVRLVDVDSDCPDCCDSCTASATACTNCDDVTPSQYEVTIDGINACSTCFINPISIGDDTKVTFLKAINSVFTLTQVASNRCAWGHVITDAINIKNYSTKDGSCGVAPGSDINYDVEIALVREASLWRLDISAFDGFSTLFCDTSPEVATGQCSAVPAFVNQSGGCGTDTDGCSFGLEYVATGGSATVVCL